MGADASIYQQFLNPVRSVSDFGAELDKRDLLKLQLQGQQGQNALLDITRQGQAQTAQQAMDDRNAIQRAAAYAAGDRDKFIAALRGPNATPGTLTYADTAEKTAADLAETKAKTQRSAGTTPDQLATTAKTAQETAYAAALHHAQGLAYVQTPEDVATYLQQGMAKGVFPQANVSPQDVQARIAAAGGVAQWVAKAKQAAIPVLEQAKIDAENSRNAATNKTSITTTGMNNRTALATNAATVGEQTRHNQATEKEGQSQVVVDPTRGPIIINKQTSLARPAVGMDGKPVGGEAPAKREAGANSLVPVIQQAKALLDQSTGSLVGAGVDATAAAVGVGTDGAQAAAKLKALEGQIMMSQPRMEGPQSDKDVALYRQMAGQIGDARVPASIKRAALETIEQLNSRYATTAGAASPAPAAAGGFRIIGSR